MTGDDLKKINLTSLREAANKLSGRRECVLLFDDIDKIADKAVEKEIFRIADDSLANGRGHTESHDNIHVVITAHSANDYRKTKYSFENSDYVCFFPSFMPYLQAERLCLKMGVNKTTLQDMIDSGSRNSIVHKVVPLYAVYGSNVCLI